LLRWYWLLCFIVIQIDGNPKNQHSLLPIQLLCFCIAGCKFLSFVWVDTERYFCVCSSQLLLSLRLIPSINDHMSFYSHALLQELSRYLVRAIDSSRPYVHRPAPLTLAAQSTYLTSLASQLLVAIRTFVNLHPNIHTKSTPRNIVINLLLANLLSHGTINPGTSLPHYRTAPVFFLTGSYSDAFLKLQPL
jgi:hypothetical protein